MKNKYFVCAAIALGLATQAFAQNLEMSPGKAALLLKSKSAWSAFECSALASKLANSPEQVRLFNFGLNQGRAFLKAAQGNKFTRAEASKVVPIGFLLVMEGPSHDFILGRLWESTADNALDDITKDQEGQLLPDDVVRIKAQAKFDMENCALLGR